MKTIIRYKRRFLESTLIAIFLTLLFIFKNIPETNIKQKSCLEQIIIQSHEVSTVATSIDFIEDELKEIKQNIEPEYYEFDYSFMTEHERKINEEISKIKQSDITTNEKIIKIGKLLCNESDITYTWGACLFNWDNTLYDTDFETPGFYYKDGMELDCSSFIQYLVWIATVEDTYDTRTGGILIGRATYFQTIEGESINEPDICTLCFRFNGGSGIKREGELININEVATEDNNHVAIYIGDGNYLDCSSAANGLRISNIADKPSLSTFYTWYRTIPDDLYVTNLEIEYMSKWY